MPRPPDDDEDGFLGRWSRRKLEARGRGAPESEAPPAASPSSAGPAPPDGQDEETLSDAELLERLALPDPDTLKPGDDFSAFLREAVPERLRRRALRRLWLSNPALANLDELVDYGEDFTDAATVVERLQTVYEVGKGAARRFLEVAPDDAPASAPEASPGPQAQIAPPSRAQRESPADSPASEAEAAPPTEESTGFLAEEAPSDAAPQRKGSRPKPARFRFD